MRFTIVLLLILLVLSACSVEPQPEIINSLIAKNESQILAIKDNRLTWISANTADFNLPDALAGWQNVEIEGNQVELNLCGWMVEVIPMSGMTTPSQNGYAIIDVASGSYVSNFAVTMSDSSRWFLIFSRDYQGDAPAQQIGKPFIFFVEVEQRNYQNIGCP